MENYYRILQFLGEPTTRDFDLYEVRSEVDQIYRCLDLETIIRFYEQEVLGARK